MKRSIALALLAAFVVAPSVLAIDLTPEQAMQKMMSCAACKPFSEYPQLTSQIRYDVHQTQNGFVATFALADESLMPALRECEKKCEATQIAAMQLSPEEAADQLCPFCQGMFSLMSRDDVSVEIFPTALGHVTVGWSNSDDGVAALHDYAQTATDFSELLAQAAAKMSFEQHAERDENATHNHDGHNR